ncbi:hypothetical protein TRFO_05928 [Tritrichomonas foetus]|uniref:Uncharacterized protein n=1 Tax=Tritrichomonas foetus TaxID=1144522 RepID=A0A1J4K1T4_9EUKA|nr:hypothetical protein TRFO_05928 [Tritrichomonas foetus]|eukprot:OHT05351.1 hypothetical protein TRFO_05928 [Tritrichomonas foetus]
MTNEERNEYMRQIRHEAQANKNRAKQLQVGPPADNAFENRNKAPNGKMVNPDFYKPNQQRNDSPSKVERIAKHEISEEDRRRIYEEQRAAFKSYRNRGRLLDNGADMKEAIEDSSYQPEPYKDERIAKHEISEEDRRKIYEEQRAAFKAYRNRGRLFDNGADMKEAIENPGYQPEPYKDERIAKHEISEADRRKIYEEQRAAFKSYRNRGRLLDNGSDMKEAIEDSSYQPEPYKDERIAKHEISEADRRRIYEEQRAAFKSYRNRGRLFDNGADMKEAIENPGYQPEPYKDERIAKHEISEADRRKIYEEQHAAFKKYKNRGRVVDSFVEDEPPSGNNYDNNNSKYNNDYQNNVYNQNDNDYNDYDNKNDRYDNNDNKNYDYNNNDNNNDDYYNDNNDDYYYNDDNDNNSYNDNNYNNDNYYNDEYKDDYNDNFNNNNNNNDDYNDNYNNDYKDDKDFEESIQEQLPQWARAPTKREKLPKQIHAAGSPRFYEEVGNDDDDNVDDEPISVSRQNTASNFVENRKAQNNRPQRKIQLDSDDEAYNTNEEENDIHLPESGKSTMDFDELKKSARIFNSPKEDILKNVDIDAPKELHKHAKKMAKLHDLAMSLKEALELPEKHNFEDDFEDFDDDQQLQKGRQKQQQQVFYIDDKEVVFPIASDKESMQFRIESMRNYLEKQIGLQKLIALNNELINKSKDDATPTPIISDLSPGLVCLAEQLLVIDTPNRP